MGVTIHRDVAQGTPEWHELRRGIPTASVFSHIIARGEGRMRTTLLYKLAGEIISGEPASSFTNDHMRHGQEHEEHLRSLYCLLKDCEAEQVGFVSNDECIPNGKVGASPDALIGRDGVLEIKRAEPHILIPLILKGEFPPEHKAQTQGALWVSNREWVDIAVGYKACPLFCRRAYRDDDFIKRLEVEVGAFHHDLMETVERVRRLERLGKTGKA